MLRLFSGKIEKEVFVIIVFHEWQNPEQLRGYPYFRNALSIFMIFRNKYSRAVTVACMYTSKQRKCFGKKCSLKRPGLSSGGSPYNRSPYRHLQHSQSIFHTGSWRLRPGTRHKCSGLHPHPHLLQPGWLSGRNSKTKSDWNTGKKNFLFSSQDNQGYRKANSQPITFSWICNTTLSSWTPGPLYSS